MFGRRLLIFWTNCLSPVLASLISSIKALFTSSDPLALLEDDRTMITSFIISMPAGDVAAKQIDSFIIYQNFIRLRKAAFQPELIYEGSSDKNDN